MRFLSYLFIVQLVLMPLGAPVLHAAEHAHAEDPADYYQCSMHPWIVSDKLENCPVCGMKLTKTHRGHGGAELTAGRAPVYLSPERQQLIGVVKEEAKVRPLVYSVHSVGHVAYNPDIANALAEYREAYAAYRKARSNPTEKVKERAMRLMELAELKLRLAGMSSDQVGQVKNASFDSRILKDFFAPENLELPEGKVWVDADLYESDSELVKLGNQVVMAAPSLPGQVFRGVVRTSDPLLNEFPRKLRIRIETEHQDVLKDGMSVDVRILVDLGEKLSIPEAAVLDSGHSQIVFVDLGEGTLEPRQVQVGRLADGYCEIMGGLHEGEKVITSAAFLIDSESRLRAAAQSFSKAPGEAAPAPGHRH